MHNLYVKLESSLHELSLLTGLEEVKPLTLETGTFQLDGWSSPNSCKGDCLASAVASMGCAASWREVLFRNTVIQWSSHNLLEIDCDCRSVSSLSHISHSQILGSVTPACKSNGCSTLSLKKHKCEMTWSSVKQVYVLYCT